MTFMEAILREILYDSSGYTARVECNRKIHFQPGQYFLGNHPDNVEEILPVPLYPVALPDPMLPLAPCPSNWQAGNRILLRGPFGNGFHLPEESLRVALFDWEGLAHLLVPLMQRALSQQAAVVLYASVPPSNLPPEVEVLPLEALSESFEWCDYLAGVIHRDSLAEFYQATGWKHSLHLPAHAEVLVHTPMPCGGMGDCGVCAVLEKRDWRLACKDGPVFSLHHLEVA